MEEHNQLQQARERLPQDETHEKEFNSKGVSQHLHELKEKGKCAFCEHPAFIKIDDSAVMVCTHCFRIIEENLSSIKAFLGCK